MARKKKIIKKVDELPEEAKTRVNSLGGKNQKTKKQLEKPEFLQRRGPQQVNSPKEKSLFKDIFSEEMKVEELELPSRGKAYGWDDGIIKLRPYQTAEQKIISTMNQKNYNSIITKLLNACIIDPSPKDFPTTEYTLGDEIAILFWLRASSWSPKYEFAGITCDSCGKKNTQPVEYDLTKIDFEYLEETPIEPIEVVLNDRVTIAINLLRRKDELEVERILKKLEKMKMQSAGEEYIQKFISSTEEIIIDGSPYEGVMDAINLMKFFDEIPAKLLEKIENEHQKYQHGIKTMIEYQCPYCEVVSAVALPIDQSFFFHGL